MNAPASSDPSPQKRAILWMAWGQTYVQEAARSLASTRHLGYPSILITDRDTAASASETDLFDHVIEGEFAQGKNGLLAKTELWKWLPEQYDTFLFLDTDTRVLEDIRFGFEKAEEYDLAVVPAAHYCLDHFWGFDEVMKAESVAQKGQLQYNTGVLFFRRTPAVEAVFEKWEALASTYAHIHQNDQPYFTLAMDQLDFRPYPLSMNYNYRGMGVPIIGPVRIWHTPHEPPAELNDQPDWWPMRYFRDGSFYRPHYRQRQIKQWIRRQFDRLKLNDAAKYIRRTLRYLGIVS